jgi:hypothetical protein
VAVSTMSGSDKDTRKYPPFWDKFIPIFLAVIALAILGLILVALSVILG